MKTPEQNFNLEAIEQDLAHFVEYGLETAFDLQETLHALQLAKEIAEGKAFVCRVEDIPSFQEDKTNIVAFNPKGKGYNGGGGEAKYEGGWCISRFDYASLSGDRKVWALPHCCDGVSYIEPTHYLTFNGSPALPTIKE